MADPVKWGSEFLVNTTTSGAQFEPGVAALSNGGFVVTWTDLSLSADDSSGRAVRAQIFGEDGKAIGGEFLVNTSTTDNQEDPVVAGLANGGFVIAWVGPGTSNSSDVYFQLYDGSGTPVGGQTKAHEDLGSNQWPGDVVGLADGKFVVVWNDTRDYGASPGDSQTDVFGRVFNADGTAASADFRVNTDFDEYQDTPSISALTGGGFVVVWDEWSDGNNAILAQHYTSSGAASGGEIEVAGGDSTTMGDPSVAALTGGGYVVVWEDETNPPDDDSARTVMGQLLSETGAKIGDAFFIDDPGSGNQYDPAVTALESGGFMVSWHGGSYNNEYNLGDMSGGAVHAQEFDANGDAVSDRFLVNTTTESTQKAPTIATLEDGRVVVAWQDYYGQSTGLGDDTSWEAIRAQFIDPRGTVIAGTNDDETLFGNSLGNTINGMSGDDSILGYGGNDVVYGAAGNDTVDAGGGNDFVTTADGDDNVTGGWGNDQIFAGDGADSIYGAGGADELGAGSGDDLVFGAAGNDTVYGGSGNDELSAGTQNDVVWAGSGVDTIYGGDGNDVLGGGLNGDELFAGAGNDVIYSGSDASSDMLYGGSGADEMFGGKGNDILSGGTGNDELFGGSGNDTFVCEAGFGDDSIGGFASLGSNTIDLSALGLSGFGALDVSQSGVDVIVDTGEGAITLWNTSVGDISASDFVF